MDEIISVVVPIYKIQNSYFEKCINSILNQTYTNIQLILILDGANEEVYRTCLNYQKNDTRILIYKQNNLGVSSARNKGIELAKGKYITFIDSDDWIELDSFERFYKKIIKEKLNFDFVMYKSYVNKKENINDFVTINLDKDVSIDEKFIINIFQTVYGTKYGGLANCESVWGNFYNREYIIKNKILFKEGIEIGEDLLFNIDVWNNSKNSLFVNEFVYHYRVNEFSVMNADYEIVKSKYDKLLVEFYQKQQLLKNEYSKNFEVFYLKQIMRTIRKYFFINNKKIDFFKEVQQLKKICETNVYKQNLKKIKFKCLPLKKKIVLFFIRFKLYNLFGIFILLFYKR